MDRVSRNRVVEKPGEGDRGIQDKLGQTRPSSIRFFTVTAFVRLALFRIRSMSANTSSRFVSARAGITIAANSPRRVIPIRSPSEARSTISDNFCFASKSPMVRIYLDDYPRLYASGQPRPKNLSYCSWMYV